MKKSIPFHAGPVRNTLLTLFCYLLVAACMQNDESLAPRNLQAADELQANDAARLPNMKTTFTAQLSAANELPTAAGPVVSKGRGLAVFHLSDDGASLHYKLIVANIANVTQSHIHCGPAGVNGSVVVFLFGLVPTGVNVNGVLAEGDITAANIIARPESASCSGGLQTFDDLLRHIREGSAYVNVHTLAYPGGEIRGQLD